MFSDLTRRDFIKTSAGVAASLPALASFGGIAHASAMLGGSEITATRVDSDLLRAVGERIGFDAAERIGADRDDVSLMYFDYAGQSIDSLREGIERGLAIKSSGKVIANELDLPYGALLGVAVVRNLRTAVETRVEICATMLSHLALIEANAPTAGIAKTSVMAADASYFYEVAATA